MLPRKHKKHIQEVRKQHRGGSNFNDVRFITEMVAWLTDEPPICCDCCL